MDAFLDGFAVVSQPENLLYCLIGVLIGMLIGVLPGLGPAATMAILLPIVVTVDPVAAVIMLAGIYYGAQYGGTITSVLLRLRSEEHTSELQSPCNLVCRLLLEQKYSHTR